MAKKQTAENAETKPADSATPGGDQAAPEAKESKPKKARAPKGEPKAETGDKEAKAAPVAEAASDGAPAAPKAPAVLIGAGDVKKKKKLGIPPRRGKKLRKQLQSAVQKLEKEGTAPLKKAVSLLKTLRRAKFDETVEVHMSLGIDSTQSDQLVRGTVALPHGIGKTVRVVVFCQGDNVAKAKEAGADFAGSDDLIEKIQKQNWLDFDVALATQDLMGKVSRLGKTLGPRGLMPTPKAGTVITGDVASAVKDFKAGKVEYRTDKGGNVHAGVGKMSFEEDKLTDNITAFIDAIRAAKPTGIKGNYIKSISVCATMTPSVSVAM